MSTLVSRTRTEAQLAGAALPKPMAPKSVASQLIEEAQSEWVPEASDEVLGFDGARSRGRERPSSRMSW